MEEREEGGTPAIVESIRAGLVMQLKEAVTPEVIVSREEDIVKFVFFCSYFTAFFEKIAS